MSWEIEVFAALVYVGSELTFSYTAKTIKKIKRAKNISKPTPEFYFDADDPRHGLKVIRGDLDPHYVTRCQYSERSEQEYL